MLAIIIILLVLFEEASNYIDIGIYTYQKVIIS